MTTLVVNFMDVNMEVEYNEETDEHFIIIPDKILKALGWEEGTFLEFEYDIIEDVLRLINEG